MLATVTRASYCEFLICTQINYTCTYFADHAQGLSHDGVRNYLKKDKITSSMIYKQVKDEIIPTEEAYLVFDDTVADKNYSRKIAMVRRQWSGNAKRIIRGIGIVNCVYVNPITGKYWIIDYRIFNPDGDGKTKLEHMQDMLNNVVLYKKLPFRGVLMDTWYAKMEIMKLIEKKKKVYYCPLQENRLVNDTNGEGDYQRIDQLEWSEEERAHGKKVHIRGFPKGHQVRMFRLVVSKDRTDYVVTNEVTQNDRIATERICGYRWKIEQFHREVKQLTGLEMCQCRLQRIQRIHIACCMLVWERLKQIATQTEQTIYQVKHRLLDDYMCNMLRNPPIKMRFA